jgi:hypothetical protein
MVESTSLTVIEAVLTLNFSVVFLPLINHIPSSLLNSLLSIIREFVCAKAAIDNIMIKKYLNTDLFELK